MSIKEKMAVIRGAGHNIPAGLDEILEDLHKRLEALEPKKKEEPKSEVKDAKSIFAPAKTDPSQAKSDEYKLTPTPVTLTKVGSDPT